MNADEIIVMQNGEIIERGAHQQLLAANGAYTRMWNLQQQEEEGAGG
jgi:ATP-binding cassette subfamily B protein